MAVYKTRWFNRWANKERLEDPSLCAAVQEMLAGLYDADLGGGLVKKRVPRSGGGKRGGFRTLIATNKGDRWVFVYGFPKNDRSNIDPDEEKALKKVATSLLSLDDIALEKAKQNNELIEVDCDAEEKVSNS
jgi:hypothetical protein